MTVVLVAEQGAQIAARRGQLVIKKKKKVLRRIRADEVEQLSLMGYVSLTPPAIRLVLRRGIPTTFLTRGGELVGRLTGGMSKNVVLRHAQHLAFSQEPARVGLARAVIRAKIANQRRLLQRAQRGRRDEHIARAAVALRLAVGRLDDADTVDVLRGHEGEAAARYFGVFGRLIQPEWARFERRRRRPPPDPANLLLSFGYTLLTNLVTGMCEQAGFDPFVGALHGLSYGRPSLALDLVEEFRPLIVDQCVLTAFNTRQIQRGDFIFVDEPDDAVVEEAWAQDAADADEEPRSLLFRKEGALKWLTAIERRFEQTAYYPPRQQKLKYRDIIRAQVYRLAQQLEGGAPYEGFTGPG